MKMVFLNASFVSYWPRIEAVFYRVFVIGLPLVL